ncbi:MAG: M18 family aminopeptidase [Fibrobacterales bacterium]
MAITQLLDFLNTSISPYHAVESARDILTSQGFTELKETEEWIIEPKKSYFVCREDSSFIAFKTPQSVTNIKTSIIGSHTDSPTLKIKPNPEIQTVGYHSLAVEVYGSPIFTTWLDRSLKWAGVVVYDDSKGKTITKKVSTKHSFRIPQLAIHINRGVNSEGQKLNPQFELNPMIGLGNTALDFKKVLKKECGIHGRVLSWDLGLYEDSPAHLGGMQDEFVFGGRQDNLVMVSASLDALSNAPFSKKSLQCIAAFNHEEIGSSTRTGADSGFLDTTLKRAYRSLGLSDEAFDISMAHSFAISADGAHAVHPNLSEKHDANHRPMMNGGPVIKVNSNMRYTSTPETIARFKKLCEQCKVPYQQFSSRNDIPCGSTIGNMLSMSLGVPTVDVGSAMLAMHSCSETTGSKDYDSMVRVFKECLKN